MRARACRSLLWYGVTFPGRATTGPVLVLQDSFVAPAAAVSRVSVRALFTLEMVLGLTVSG